VTKGEVVDVLSVVRMLWPHLQLGGDPAKRGADVVALWLSFLEGHEAQDVELAVRELAATGERFPGLPVLLSMVAQRGAALPEWDEVREEILRAIRSYRPPREDAMVNPYAMPPEDYWSHPVIARFVESVWDEWRMAPDPGVDAARGQAGTFFAQQRDAFKALRARAERGVALEAVAAPRGLRRLDMRASLGRGGG
jgi:hypothetical protein